MKGFLVFLALVGLLAGAYFFVPQVRKAVDTQWQLSSRAVRGTGGLLEQEVEEGTTASRTSRSSDGAAALSQSAAAPAPAEKDQVRGSLQPEAPRDPAASPGTGSDSSGTVTPSPTASGAGEDADKYAKAYPLPEFKSLEEIVGEWRKIPPSAFPREVEISEPVEMVIAGGAGRSTLPTGSTVTALEISGSTLTIAPHRGASARARIDIDKTTLKEVLGGVYENFKKRKIQAVLAQRDRARRADRAHELNAIAAQEAKQRLLGPKPEQNGDGTVPAMVASINAKDVTEFHIGEIEGWGPLGYDEIEGEPYWIGTVRYTAETIFGKFPAEAMALMRQGKVVKWLYSGSLEPVP